MPFRLNYYFLNNNSENGIRLDRSPNNSIVENIVCNNSVHGIIIDAYNENNIIMNNRVN
ncbi:MAG: hypothetical protein ACTSR8_10085 [Promethearchaeota archaeon]